MPAVSANTLLNQLALCLLPHVGNITAKKLIAYCGSVEGVFKQKKNQLLAIPDVGEKTAESILAQSTFARAEEELKFMEANGVTAHFYLEPSYPKRLKALDDAPVLLFTKGQMQLNPAKSVAIVGTRRCTEYGKDVTAKLVEELGALQDVLIVSGLAYGIDVEAHKAALKHNIATVGVVAHGLDRVYPSIHTKYAKRMEENGGLVSDIFSSTEPDKMYFARRNRLIAGMADCTIVVESAAKGGSLITADFAADFNRDVFCIPGPINAEFSAGCNQYIRDNKAALITSTADLIKAMNWDINPNTAKGPIQPALFVDLTPDEQAIVTALQPAPLSIDDISLQANLTPSKCAAALFNLEFKGVVKGLPGKVYRLV